MAAMNRQPMIHYRMAFLKQVRKNLRGHTKGMSAIPPCRTCRLTRQLTRSMQKSITSISAALWADAGSGDSASRAIVP